MNLLKSFLFAIALACMALPSQAQVAPKSFFGSGGTALSTTNSNAIITANGTGVARVQYINGTSDATTSAFRFRVPSAVSEITVATNASQAIVIAVGTAFAANNICVVRHTAVDTYERAVVSAATATNITFVANLNATAILPGDRVYLMGTTASTIPVGNATKELNAAGGALFNGVEGNPVLIDLDGGTNVTLNAVSGVFQRTANY